ncbi:MAG: UDP-N-acetylglucosamine 2-epimerase (non-hydrolyzing) [Candidatus Omnitrophica bacterium 4484_70.2]|nr:MAG: UDP-N-acetylglucosamine 2-epimerase (non-hydrolyzing) [Candidatus Omnitrophica bacterium 4484_70.2]
MSILICLGTRPEIIKMAPVIHALKRRGLRYKVLFTGQHYDYQLCSIFLQELGIDVDYHLKIERRTPLKQLGEILIKMEKILNKEKISLVLVEGDTNSVLSTAIATNKLEIKLAHIEAGLRSYDLRMPEEHNRRMVDHISDFLFAPTQHAKENLLKENVWGKIFVTGNPVIDAIQNYFSQPTDVLKKIKFSQFALVTIHRKENVDDPYILTNFVNFFLDSPIPLLISLHPRTKQRLIENNLWEKILRCKKIQVLSPLGYADFITLMRKAQVILTDSGGIQEEATSPLIRRPVIVLRKSTERPEAVESGFAQVVGTDKEVIMRGVNNILKKDFNSLPKTSPFGEGKAGEKIVEIIATQVLAR